MSESHTINVILKEFQDMVERGVITLAMHEFPYSGEFEALYERVTSQGISISREEISDGLQYLRQNLDRSDSRLSNDHHCMICATQDGEEFEIIFRQINDNVPSHLNKGVHWQVEVWDNDVLFPIGLAFVSHGTLGAFVELVLVYDESRQRGIGRMLIDAIATRWPGAYETGGISEGGEALAARLKRHRLKYYESRRQQNGNAAAGI